MKKEEEIKIINRIKSRKSFYKSDCLAIKTKGEKQ